MGNTQQSNKQIGSPLTIAISKRNPKTVKCLLDHGANPNSSFSGIKGIPLIFVMIVSKSFSYLESYITGLSDPDIDVFSQEELEIFELLLDHGADPNSRLDNMPLISAALSCQDKSLAKIVLKYDVDLDVLRREKFLFNCVMESGDPELIELCGELCPRGEFLNTIREN